MKEKHMAKIVNLIDEVISDITNEDKILKVRKKVNEMMAEFPLFQG